MDTKETLIVNLFAGAGAGKSTLAASVFSLLKWNGVSCELVTEFAKDMVWDEAYKILDNQVYVFGQQLRRLERLIGKIDVVVTDSPLLLSIIYNQGKYSQTFDALVLDVFNRFRNLNYYVIRQKPYYQTGRVQTEQEAREIDFKLFDLLRSNQIPCKAILGDMKSIDVILNDILEKLEDKERIESTETGVKSS